MDSIHRLYDGALILNPFIRRNFIDLESGIEFIELKIEKIQLGCKIKWISVSQKNIEPDAISPDCPKSLRSLIAIIQLIICPKYDQHLYYSGNHKLNCMKKLALVFTTAF